MSKRRPSDRRLPHLVVLTLSVALWASLAAVQAPETVLWGRVVNALSGAPISGAVVTVLGQASAAPRLQLTDAEGRFLFRLASSDYRVAVTKPGYLYEPSWDPAIGEVLVAARVKTVAIPSTPLTISIWPSAEISGSVVDEEHRPVVGVNIRAEPRPRYPGTGRRPLSAMTDDRGHYRLSDVPPGSYTVAARPPAIVAVRTRPDTESRPGLDPELAAMRNRVPVLEFAEWFLQVPPTGQFITPFLGEIGGRLRVVRPIYYSDSTDAAGAQILTVRPGQNLTGINLVLPVELAYTIRGTLRAEGLPRSGFQVLALLGSFQGVESATGVVVASATSDGDGQFLLAGVPKGLYCIVALPPRPTGAMMLKDVLWAEAVVEVSTDDLPRVDLGLGSLPPFEAVVSRIGESRVALMPQLLGMRMEADPYGLPAGPSLARFSPEPDGRLNLRQLVPGDYAMHLTPPPGWVVHSLMLDGKPVVSRTIRRSSQFPSVLRINLTSEYGSALVSVRRNSTASNNPQGVVVLFPSERGLWNGVVHDTDRFRLVPIDSSGQAEFGALLPGDYLVAAINTDRPGLAWRDRRVLERLAPQAWAIRVSAHTQATALVTAVPE